jgi:hypothetical protein
MTTLEHISKQIRAAGMAAEQKESIETLPGGESDGMGDDAFDPAELAKGIKVEMEHTQDANQAKEIAKDHLTEDPEYYQKLEKMEKEEGLQTQVFSRFCARPVRLASKFWFIYNSKTKKVLDTFMTRQEAFIEAREYENRAQGRDLEIAEGYMDDQDKFTTEDPSKQKKMSRLADLYVLKKKGGPVLSSGTKEDMEDELQGLGKDAADYEVKKAPASYQPKGFSPKE